jgi:menaquinone-dependent protoporphyrinogen oxidase
MGRHVLVTSASKHGATLDITDVIAGVLSRRGLDVIDKPLDEVRGLDGYDAAVIGSAVYVGRWMSEATSLVKHHAEQLRAMPVWLFSSGPLGNPPLPAADPVEVAELVEAIAARGHRVFAGRLDPSHLGLGEKLIVRMVRAPSGDYRDFTAVEAWAHEIADALLADAGPADATDVTREALITAAGR